jgi:ketosteroid isomerase-like protein
MSAMLSRPDELEGVIVMAASATNEEVAIRRVIENWASAVRAKNINGVVARHTNDIVMYDVPPPQL